jgi:hypothetical protein
MNKIKTSFNRCFTWTCFLRIVIIISVILALWKKDYVWVVGTFIGLFISFLPSILKKDVKITLPWTFDLLIAIVSILHVGGRLLNFYISIPYYPLITRFFISILVAFIAFALIYILHIYWDGLIMDKYAMAFFVIVTTMSIGVILEFVKWLNISIIPYARDNTALMLNLSADTIAGIVIAIIGVSLIKSGEFEEITEDLGKQIDKTVIHRKKSGR